MTRRDMIIVAVLVNTGLLAMLFMMAIDSGADPVSDPGKGTPALIATTPKELLSAELPIELDTPSMSITEIDLGHNQETIISTVPNREQPETFTYNPPSQENAFVTPKNPTNDPQTALGATDTIVEITVKRGDSLEKIAKANGTTVSALKELNRLKNDRLNIGQVLRVPAGSKPIAKQVTTTQKTTEKKATTQNDVQHYTIKSGDNPWKIAKQFHLKTDELLQLNGLDEDKARNLKVGDTIRIR